MASGTQDSRQVEDRSYHLDVSASGCCKLLGLLTLAAFFIRALFNAVREPPEWQSSHSVPAPLAWGGRLRQHLQHDRDMAYEHKLDLWMRNAEQETIPGRTEIESALRAVHSAAGDALERAQALEKSWDRHQASTAAANEEAMRNLEVEPSGDGGAAILCQVSASARRDLDRVRVAALALRDGLEALDERKRHALEEADTQWGRVSGWWGGTVFYGRASVDTINVLRRFHSSISASINAGNSLLQDVESFLQDTLWIGSCLVGIADALECQGDAADGEMVGDAHALGLGARGKPAARALWTLDSCGVAMRITHEEI